MNMRDGTVDDAYKILRVVSAGVFLLISITKFLIVDYWMETYVPGFFAQTLPYQGLELLVGSAIFGIIASIMMFLDYKTFEVSLASAIMLFTVELFLLGMVMEQGFTQAPGLFADVLRNLGIVGLFFALSLVAYHKDRWSIEP